MVLRNRFWVLNRMSLLQVPLREYMHVSVSSVQFSHSVMSNSLNCKESNPMNCSMPGLPVHHQLVELAHTQSIKSVMPSILPSVIPFPSWLQSCPALWSFPVSQFFASSGQSIGTSASASVLAMNIQGWFCLGLTGLISLQSKGLLKVLSNTTVQKHQFFCAQLSLWSNSHIYTWLLEKP